MEFSNLQDSRAAVPPTPLSKSACSPGFVAGQTKPWPAPALALSGLALTQTLWLTLQTCGQVGQGRPTTLSGEEWEWMDEKRRALWRIRTWGWIEIQLWLKKIDLCLLLKLKWKYATWDVSSCNWFQICFHGYSICTTVEGWEAAVCFCICVYNYQHLCEYKPAHSALLVLLKGGVLSLIFDRAACTRIKPCSVGWHAGKAKPLKEGETRHSLWHHPFNIQTSLKIFIIYLSDQLMVGFLLRTMWEK